MTEYTPNRLDRMILNAIQRDFPVEGRPYAALSARLNEGHPSLNLDENTVFERVRALRRHGFIRRLGAVFTAAKLGYRSVLCAARVPEDKIDLFGGLVSQAPQVTHNYLRSDAWNIWFTFTCREPEELDRFLADLKKESGVDQVCVLEAEKTFKIKVNFQFSD